jgi:putative transcriptional regulator
VDAGSVHVGDRWVLTATLDILRAIAAGTGPKTWVAALGYAGWGAGQLEEELTGHGWFATPGNAALLYDCDVGSRWETAFRGAGIDPRLLSSGFGTA